MNTQNQVKINTSTLNTFLSIVVLIGIILMIPAVAMQFSDEVHWKVGDFIVMAGLLFITFSFSYILWHQAKPKYRLPSLISLVLLFLYIWTELAVGIFTDLVS